MTFGTILYTLIVRPLGLLFEAILVAGLQLTGKPWQAIIFLSLMVNILALPLYRRADRMQQKERAAANEIKDRKKQIEKTFKGDERYMILRTLYRQNDYKPWYVLRGSLPLLIQVPIFMAAYRLLSNLALLDGAALGPIADMGQPDGLIKIGALTINLLPVLMTLINFISSAIYTKGYDFKQKMQLYGIALIFLLLLYRSPAGLVFYWTLNNLFSLCKNIVMYGIMGKHGAKKAKKNIRLSEKIKLAAKAKERSGAALFLGEAMLLTVLIGLFIPSGVLAASPLEFVDLANTLSPNHYLLPSLVLAAGSFLFWLQVFYLLAPSKERRVWEFVSLVLIAIFMINFMKFGTGKGTLSSMLDFDDGLVIKKVSIKENWIWIAACAGGMTLGLALIKLMERVIRKSSDKISDNDSVGQSSKVSSSTVAKESRKESDRSNRLTLTTVMTYLVWTAAAALLIMTVKNMRNVSAEYGNFLTTVAGENGDSVSDNGAQTYNFIQLSENGKNVIVLMMDRAINGYIPYIMAEKPELVEQFDGFTYYPNTISFGGHTNFGAPALFGGYDYTVEAMNARDDMKLVDKHNEALRVMPEIFGDNDYQVTVIDPPYTNYSWMTDFSIYSDHPEYRLFSASGRFNSDPALFDETETIRYRNFFCYSIMKCMPLKWQNWFYSDAAYLEANVIFPSENADEVSHISQTITDGHTGHGFSRKFMDEYTTLQNLGRMTTVTRDVEYTFTMMDNNTTHEVAVLKEPEYIPAEFVDNTEYDEAHMDRFVLNGRRMGMWDKYQILHYEVNVAAMIELGKWFDELRARGVWDNTRIIIVADHAHPLAHFSDMFFDDPNDDDTKTDLDCMFVNPLLMVKDFNAEGFTTDNSFMTNADVPALATEGLIADPVNPFTGNPIDMTPKTLGPQKIMLSNDWSVNVNNGNTFLPGKWYSVHEDIFDMDNWEYIGYY